MDMQLVPEFATFAWQGRGLTGRICNLVYIYIYRNIGFYPPGCSFKVFDFWTSTPWFFVLIHLSYLSIIVERNCFWLWTSQGSCRS